MNLSVRPPPKVSIFFPTSRYSICPLPPSPHPARGWINVWLWETCRWQMFTFIMHDFHVAVNFSEPAKSRKWFCTLCLFNEIVTLMEVRLNKMEMAVSVCHFYDLSLSFFITVFTSSRSPGIYRPLKYSQSFLGSLDVAPLLSNGGSFVLFSFIFYQYW